VDFRVWAPRRRTVDVVFEQGDAPALALTNEGNGYFSGFHEGLSEGVRYKFQLDGDGASIFPDPAARFQPEGPHGFSETVRAEYPWGDREWQGVSLPGQIIYEMHIGTFTPQGTWAAATHQLRELASAGITVIEVMPVADFCGRYGWGYDGVNFFAPTRLYGTPRDFRQFVDVAHANGLGVILDVVYNHAGPDGNFLSQYSDTYFTSRYQTDWGAAINFDGEGSQPVREYFLANAAYWITEFHLDGVRVDATQNIYDAGTHHILAELSSAVRRAAAGRRTIVIGENEPQDPRLARPLDEGGYGFDGL
jgi:maltooligosyltrehalose trehalohydrolase